MAAWDHFNKTGWDDKTYRVYRFYVGMKASSYRGRHEDCADLAMTLLVDFAAANGLAVTFADNVGNRYISKAAGWSSKQEYADMVLRKIGVKALWNMNTVKNPRGPEAGDLMLRYEEVFGASMFQSAGQFWSLATHHHAALVFASWLPSWPHPKAEDASIPDFPGDDVAQAQAVVTEYFKGRVGKNGVTQSRDPDKAVRFDYLNSRSSAKRNAELIYFASADQATDDDFEFRMYDAGVLDNYFDWDGQDDPPRVWAGGFSGSSYRGM